jgi:rhodanese-related sulfurtransferase
MQDIMLFIQHHWMLNTALFAILFILIVLEFIHQKQSAARISPAQVTRVINDASATLIDTRPSALFNQGHIISAVSIPASEVLTSKKLTKLKSRPIVMICANGVESARLANSLAKQGFDIRVLAGGIQAWTTASMPLTKE